MLSYLGLLMSYNHEVINILRTHPARERISSQLGPTLSIDEIISILCRNLGLNATSWSLYTSTLDPPVQIYDPPISLYKIDQMLDRFHHRFGTIIVVSEPKLSTDLRTFFNAIVGDQTEYALLRRQAENLSRYFYPGACVVIGLVGDCEVAVYVKDGEIASFTINSAPLQYVTRVFIVGRLTEKVSPHLQTCSGEEITSINIVKTYYRRQKITVIKQIQIDGTWTTLDCWGSYIAEKTFILFAQKKGVLLHTETGSVIANQNHGETHRGFIIRCLHYRHRECTSPFLA